MQYKIVNGAVYYDSDMVLENIDIEINEREKIAIVGRNGSGKTTLLKAIMGEVALEEGTGEKEFHVSRTGAPVISYLRQMPFEDESLPMIEEVKRVFADLIGMEERMQALVEAMEKESDDKTIRAFSDLNERFVQLGGLTYKKEYMTVIRKFGFSEEDEQKPLSAFSGGQRTKIAFIKMLLSKPDILLLDEPTNHLDIETVEWLEGYLKNYRSTLVIVSHDRMFLDRIVDKVYEIEWGETRCYKGDYSAFEKQKQERHKKQEKDYEAQQAEIARLTRLIERFRYKATKAKMVQSKIKLLEHMERIAAPEKYDTRTYKTDFQPRMPSSRQVLDALGLTVGYEKPLATVNFRLERGQKLGIIGGNGVGKSTLLKTLTGAVLPLAGRFEFGYHTEIAYFDQQLAHIEGDVTLFDAFSRAYPALTDREVRTALGGFRFSGEDVFRPMSTLSGGEKVRLALCKILYKKPNVLILDEPTNHMDIIGKESLEEILLNYEGTVLFVSHDRYFVRKIADRLLVFEGGTATFFDGGYDAYEEKRAEELRTEEASVTTSAERTPKEPKAAKGRYVSPQKEADKKRKKLERLEQRMKEQDEKLAALNRETELPSVFSDYKRLAEIQEEVDRIEKEKTESEEEWMTLAEEIEEIERTIL